MKGLRARRSDLPSGELRCAYLRFDRDCRCIVILSHTLPATAQNGDFGQRRLRGRALRGGFAG